MAIAYVSGSDATSSTSPVSIPAPSSIVSGNLLVAIVGVYSASATAIGAPSGWTTAGLSTPDTSASNNMGVFTKIATGSEPGSYSFTGQRYLGGVILQFSGSSSLDGSPVFNPPGTTFKTSIVANSITPGAGNTTDMWVAAFTTSQAQSTPTGGFTAMASALNSFNTASIYPFYKILASAGATGTATSTCTSADNSNSVSFLLLPSAVAANSNFLLFMST